jgi:hypothetical protein
MDDDQKSTAVATKNATVSTDTIQGRKICGGKPAGVAATGLGVVAAGVVAGVPAFLRALMSKLNPPVLPTPSWKGGARWHNINEHVYAQKGNWVGKSVQWGRHTFEKATKETVDITCGRGRGCTTHSCRVKK